MEDILLLLVLLSAHTTQVSSQPYLADSVGNCLNTTTEYLLDGSNLCCKKCPPGHRLKEECSESADTVCEKCPAGQYMERWNYASNCFSCTKCKRHKGLQDAQSCSSTSRSTCVCLSGMFCVMGFEDPYCTTSCNTYIKCKVGYGVSAPGMGDSDVRCERCPSGTFSDTVSSTDPCRPHTNCQGRAVVREGDAASDTVCENLTPSMLPQTSTKQPHAETTFTTATTVMSTASANSDIKTPHGRTDSTPSMSLSVSEAELSYATKSPPPSTTANTTLAAVIACVIGLILLFITVILLVLCKIRRKDAEIFHPKVDANGNCESGDKQINKGYLVETQLTSLTVTSPEQQCLLQNGEACSDHSQSSNTTETSARTVGSSSQESIGPLQSTIALPSPHSLLSEPLTLVSDTESFTPLQSFPSQPSSQPTSPQVNSPVTSPSVNVNITVHIGNGSCGTPSITPADLMQVDSKLPFGEEEESFSIPQQEDGKQSLMSVQESDSYNT